LYGIEVRETRESEMLVELWGEFDLFAIEPLREVLSGVASLRQPTVVDLSGVTFLDAYSIGELAVHSQLYAHHFAFRKPSWQVEASMEACGLNGWFRNPHSERAEPISSGIPPEA
jgi:anti-anti-sigma factor